MTSASAVMVSPIKTGAVNCQFWFKNTVPGPGLGGKSSNSWTPQKKRFNLPTCEQSHSIVSLDLGSESPQSHGCIFPQTLNARRMHGTYTELALISH